MAYTKPQIIAQNASSGSYAAGCPANTRHWPAGSPSWKRECAQCEITN
ncbi:MAG: hypothetical protein J6X67_11025 [Treponema sp.]|nr:hypothetical protein [Treponema sp.]MBQ1670781.1 hypothetical protein [Treponema sp.]